MWHHRLTKINNSVIYQKLITRKSHRQIGAQCGRGEGEEERGEKKKRRNFQGKWSLMYFQQTLKLFQIKTPVSGTLC